jgi:hypothetical protein
MASARIHQRRRTGPRSCFGLASIVGRGTSWRGGTDVELTPCAADLPKSVALGTGAAALDRAKALTGSGRAGSGERGSAGTDGAGAAAALGCSTAAAWPWAVPHQGQNFTGRGIGRAQAGLMQR